MTLSDYLRPLSHAELKKLHEQLALALENMDARRDEPYMGFTRVMVCQVAEELTRRAPVSPEMRRVENLRAAVISLRDSLDRVLSAPSIDRQRDICALRDSVYLALKADDRAAESGGR